MQWWIIEILDGDLIRNRPLHQLEARPVDAQPCDELPGEEGPDEYTPWYRETEHVHTKGHDGIEFSMHLKAECFTDAARITLQTYDASWDILDRWEKARKAGIDLSVDTLCLEYPSLIEYIENFTEALIAMDNLLSED